MTPVRTVRTAPESIMRAKLPVFAAAFFTALAGFAEALDFLMWLTIFFSSENTLLSVQ